MADKVIGVKEEVHQKVAKIAKANYRGLGDQVEYWADHSCVHPQECREGISVVVAFVDQPKKKAVARVGPDQPFRGFFCSQCGKYVFPLPDADVETVS